MSLSRLTSLIDLFKSSSGTRTSPPLLLDTAYDELDHTSRGTASFLNYRLTFHIVL